MNEKFDARGAMPRDDEGGAGEEVSEMRCCCSCGLETISGAETTLAFEKITKSTIKRLISQTFILIFFTLR